MPNPVMSAQADYGGPLSSRNPNMTGPAGSAYDTAHGAAKSANSYNTYASNNNYNNKMAYATSSVGNANIYSTGVNTGNGYGNSSNNPYASRGYPQSSSMPGTVTQYTGIDPTAYPSGGYAQTSAQPPIMLGGIPSSSSMPVVVVPSVSADATTPLPPTHTRVVPSHSSSSHHRHRYSRHHHDRDRERETAVGRSNTMTPYASGVGGAPNLVPVLALAAPPMMSPEMGPSYNPPVPGVLRVHVHRGEGFKSTHALTRAAPYVVLTLGSHARKTRFVKTTNGAAHWDEQLELDVADARVEWLQVRVQDRHRLHADGVVGRRAELPLQRLCYGQLHPADADTTEGRVVLTLVLLPPGQGYGKRGMARKMPNLTRRGRTKKRDGKRGTGGRAPSPVDSDEFSHSDCDDDSDEMEREAYYRQNMAGTPNTVTMPSMLAR